METQVISAAEARKITDKKVYDQVFVGISEKIKKAAEKGERHITVFDDMSNKDECQLLDLGYTLLPALCPGLRIIKW